MTRIDACPARSSVRTVLLPDFVGLAVLGLVFSLMTLVWLTGYALATARMRDALRRPRIRRTLDGITGVALIGLGVRLAAEER